MSPSAPSSLAPVLRMNDAPIPSLGFGTSQLRGGACVRAVEDALAAGYRHIDTAVMYANEAEVGRALKASGRPREDVFITTKVLPEDIGAGSLQASARGSVERLDLDIVDLLLIHWPNSAIPLSESVAALCEARASGLARHIGVANFSIALLEEAARLAAEHGERLVANQCEYHPRLDQSKLLGACRRLEVVFVSYCPLGRGGLVDDPKIQALARRIGRSPAQTILRWHVQQPGVAAIPRSANPAHLRENLDIFDFELSDADMRDMSALAAPDGRLLSPRAAPDWD